MSPLFLIAHDADVLTSTAVHAANPMYEAQPADPVLRDAVKLVVWDLDHTFWKGVLSGIGKGDITNSDRKRGHRIGKGDITNSRHSLGKTGKTIVPRNPIPPGD